MIDRRINEPRPRTGRRGKPKKLAPAALAAVTALGLPLVAALGGATPAGAASDSAAYLTATVASSPTTAKTLSSTPPGTATKVFNETGTRTGWLELWSQGSSGRSLRSSQPAPSGHGYVLGSASLENTTIPAGAWAPRVSLLGRGKLTVVPMVRAYKLSAAGQYSLIGSSQGSRTALTTTAVQVNLPTFTGAATAWAPGDRLYVDLLTKVVVAASAAGYGVEHVENGGANQSVTFPAPVPVTQEPSTPPTTSPTPPASSGVWRPAPGTSWQWQITGSVDPSLPVAMYDIDLFDAQPAASSYTVPGFGTVNVPKGDNAGVISTLHSAGKVVICYLDTGAWENYRPDQGLFPAAVIGNSSGWSGEKWLDIRAAAWPSFKPLIEARLDLAKRSGCDGVEPDQNNPWGNKPGFTISLADQKAWYLEVARMAHARGLSVGQKNGIETTDADTIAAFDWNLNEECNMYSECDVLTGFIKAGKAVFQVEYTDEGMTYDKACPANNARNFDGLLKTLDLDTWRQPCR